MKKITLKDVQRQMKKDGYWFIADTDTVVVMATKGNGSYNFHAVMHKDLNTNFENAMGLCKSMYNRGNWQWAIVRATDFVTLAQSKEFGS